LGQIHRPPKVQAFTIRCTTGLRFVLQLCAKDVAPVRRALRRKLRPHSATSFSDRSVDNRQSLGIEFVIPLGEVLCLEVPTPDHVRPSHGDGAGYCPPSKNRRCREERLFSKARWWPTTPTFESWSISH